MIALAATEPPAPRNGFTSSSSNYLPPNQSFNGNNGYNYNSNDNGYNYPSSSNGENYPATSQQYGPPLGNDGNGGYNYEDANVQPAKYSFEYNVQDFTSGNDFGHMESRDGDRTVGRYFVLLPDGRKQVSEILMIYLFISFFKKKTSPWPFMWPTQLKNHPILL